METRSASVMTISTTTTKWILFFSMCAIVPVFYFMFVFAGLLPLLAVLLIALNNTDSWAVILISAVHCVIYSALFYFVSSVGSYRLGRFPRRKEIKDFR